MHDRFLRRGATLVPVRTAFLAFAVGILLSAAPLSAQDSPDVHTSGDVDIASEPTEPALLEHHVDETLVWDGVITLVGSMLIHGAVSGFTMFALYFEGATLPCYPSLCGFDAMYAISWAPVVGPSIWAAMVVDSTSSPVAHLGFGASVGELIGVALIVAGLSGHEEPVRVTPIVAASPFGASIFGVTAEGRF